MLLSLVGGACAASSVVTVVAGLLVRRAVRERQRVSAGHRVGEAIARSAKRLELQEVGAGVFEGRIRGRRVRWTLRDVEYDHGPRLQLAIGTPVPTGTLGLTHRTMSYGALPPALEHPLCRIGEAEFDVRFFIHADLEHLSLMTPPVRRALLDAGSDAELRIRSGWLWLDHVAVPELADAAPGRVDWLFKAAIAFDGVQAEVEHRVRRLCTDPNARVRARALELLSNRGASEFTTWIARGLLDDPDPTVRARAAETAADGARLAAVAREASAPVDVRRRAARVLTDVGTVEERVGLALILARPPHALPDIAFALVRALAEAAEPVLIELVDADDSAVARQAVGMLGRVGSARTLVILQALVDNEGRHGMLRHEASAALDALRARSGRPNPRSNPPEPAPAVVSGTSGRMRRPTA